MEVSVGAVVVKGVSLILVGSLLSIGFWIGKKMTNQADLFLAMRSKDIKQLTQQEGVI